MWIFTFLYTFTFFVPALDLHGCAWLNPVIHFYLFIFSLYKYYAPRPIDLLTPSVFRIIQTCPPTHATVLPSIYNLPFHWFLIRFSYISLLRSLKNWAIDTKTFPGSYTLFHTLLMPESFNFQYPFDDFFHHINVLFSLAGGHQTSRMIHTYHATKRCFLMYPFDDFFFSLYKFNMLHDQ